MRKLTFSSVIVLFLAICAIPLGCAGGVYSYDDFIDDLQDSGASVEIGGEVTVGLFSVKGRVVRINSELTNVLEYDNEALADEEATFVYPDGDGMEKVTGPGETTQALWSLAGPTHFYKKGRLIVYYIDVSNGSDPSMRNLLESILGSQFAGAP